MDSDQYEELCRRYIADQAGIDIGDVRSRRIPNATRPGLREYTHQIDLYWETGDAAAQYINIADAKWRRTSKVDQDDVLSLQKVLEEISGHKAFMITNVGYTAGAQAAADQHRIALHVLSPTFDPSSLPHGDRAAIQAALREQASTATGPIYSFRVEHRGLGFAATVASAVSPPVVATPSVPSGHQTRVLQSPTRIASSPSLNRSITTGGGATRGGPGPSSNARGGGFLKK